MKIAFAKNPKSIFSRAICLWTRKKHYHTELVFSSGISFSAKPEENRTRFKYIQYDENWDFIHLQISEEEEQLILEFCISENDCKYDWVGIILTQVIPLSRQSRTKWFCSEICTAALQKIGFFTDKKPHQIDPGELYIMLTKQLRK